MLRTGVEVVVVGREASFRQPLRLLVAQHPGGHAGLHPQLTHTTHHRQHGFKGSPIADLPPGPAHAETIGAGLLGRPGPLQHRLHLHLSLEGGDITAVVNRLGAVGTVLFAAAGFHAQQRGQLHPVTGVGGAVHGLRLPEQLHQRQFQQRLDFGDGPVVAN